MNHLKDKIKETYAGVVTQNKQEGGCCSPAADAQNSCCGSELTIFQEDYSQLPGYNPDADFGLGCGIPVAYANIKPGQTVLDLGSGAGNDVFVARSLTGETGRVIGLDMTPAMVAKANENKQKLGFQNVEFILGEIENIPLPESSVDVVISNCVLNLVPDKTAAFTSIYRVLKPAGHFTISDIVLSGELTDKMKGIAELYAGCIAGALVKQDYLSIIEQVGFKQIDIKTERVIYLPDSFLLQYLTQAELIAYRSTGVQVLSITVWGSK